MYRQIIGYVPSNVISAIVSIAMVYAYTRLLSPAAFGIYSYVFAVVLVLQTSLFYAPPIALTRFFPGAARDGRRDGLLKEAYLIFYGMCFAVVVISICAWPADSFALGVSPSGLAGPADAAVSVACATEPVRSTAAAT